MKYLSLFTLLVLIQSCTPAEKSEREIQKERIKDEAFVILADLNRIINTDKARGLDILDISPDDILNQWRKINIDSVELGLSYVQELDSTYFAKKEGIINDAKQKLKNLKKKFNFEKDEFQDIGFYSHKRWEKNWLNRKNINSGVNSSGYTWLRSCYAADDWIFHTSIHVLIDGKKLTSSTIPSYDKNNRRENSGGRIWEIVTYEESDLVILKELANNVDKKIKVRFNGDKYHNDITLSRKDKQALKDCYDLGQLLKLTQID